ncbi:hypothetical protein BDR26DRAFT_868458 [Obelidium mucronatum]|nr:hypothetical protein BDR26DRAFT_868458 [Obelidium mucronatum]
MRIYQASLLLSCSCLNICLAYPNDFIGMAFAEETVNGPAHRNKARSGPSTNQMQYGAPNAASFAARAENEKWQAEVWMAIGLLSAVSVICLLFCCISHGDKMLKRNRPQLDVTAKLLGRGLALRAEPSTTEVFIIST